MLYLITMGTKYFILERSIDDLIVKPYRIHQSYQNHTHK